MTQVPESAEAKLKSYELMTDLELIESAVKDDREAFKCLFVKYQQLVRIVVRRQVRLENGVCEPDLEDIAQQVWLRVWRSLSMYDPDEGRFAAWLTVVAKRLAIDLLRNLQRRRRIEAPAGQTHSEVEDEKESTYWFDRQQDDSLASPEKRLENNELIDAALDSLSAEDLKIVQLRYYKGLTPAEISERTGICIWTVYARLKRIERLLREWGDASQ